MTRQDVAELVVRMAVDNPRWGYTRIRGALSNLGHTIARTTVKRILHDHGVDPAPERSRHMPWKTFLQAHWEGLAACDLCTVEVLTLAGLRRHLVFFVIELRSRRVTIAGIHPQPGGAWMEQQARNVTDPVDGCLRRARPLIHDRDPLDTRVFGEILESAGVQPIRLPPKSPNLNAYAERFVRSINEECLTRVVPLGRGASASSRLRVHRTRPSREKPPGTRQPAPATTTTSAKAGRRRSAAGTPRRITQFLQSRGRMRGRPIKRTLRGGNLQPLKIKTFYELGVRDSCLGVLAAVVVRRGQPPFCPENTPATSLAGPGCPPLIASTDPTVSPRWAGSSRLRHRGAGHRNTGTGRHAGVEPAPAPADLTGGRHRS